MWSTRSAIRKTLVPSLAGFTAIATIAATACSKETNTPRPAPGETGGETGNATIAVTSPAFVEGQSIPVDYTCDGKNVMPELDFGAIPASAKSLAVIVDDPDAPKGTFTHMVAFDLAADVHRLPSGESLAAAGPNARFGRNDFNAAKYSGPCPPRGQNHRYVFRVFAVDTMTNLKEGAPRADVERAIDGHVVGEGTLTGRFGH